jgi:hypothetical protein
MLLRGPRKSRMRGASGHGDEWAARRRPAHAHGDGWLSQFASPRWRRFSAQRPPLTCSWQRPSSVGSLSARRS